MLGGSRALELVEEVERESLRTRLVNHSATLGQGSLVHARTFPRVENVPAISSVHINAGSVFHLLTKMPTALEPSDRVPPRGKEVCS